MMEMTIIKDELDNWSNYLGCKENRYGCNRVVSERDGCDGEYMRSGTPSTNIYQGESSESSTQARPTELWPRN